MAEPEAAWGGRTHHHHLADRFMYSPAWWKLSGSQYGKLKTWTIDDRGTWIDGAMVSTQTINALGIPDHHSIRFRIGIDENAENPGGLNIFGKGFGDFDQDIVMMRSAVLNASVIQ